MQSPWPVMVENPGKADGDASAAKRRKTPHQAAEAQTGFWPPVQVQATCLETRPVTPPVKSWAPNDLWRGNSIGLSSLHFGVFDRFRNPVAKLVAETNLIRFNRR